MAFAELLKRDRDAFCASLTKEADAKSNLHEGDRSEGGDHLRHRVRPNQ
jgi:hypothetical protein